MANNSSARALVNGFDWDRGSFKFTNRGTYGDYDFSGLVVSDSAKTNYVLAVPPSSDDSNFILTTTALTGAPQTILAASLTRSLLDFPRNLTAVATAPASSHIHITGVDANGDAATDILALTGTVTVVGTKSFSRIISVLIDTLIDGAANIIIGVGNDLETKTSTSLYITDILISNGANAGTVKIVGDPEGTPYDITPTFYIGVSSSQAIHLETPIKVPANNAIGLTSATVTNHSVLVSGYAT